LVAYSFCVARDGRVLGLLSFHTTSVLGCIKAAIIGIRPVVSIIRSRYIQAEQQHFNSTSHISYDFIPLVFYAVYDQGYD
jgi:hypothetical protein